MAESGDAESRQSHHQFVNPQIRQFVNSTLLDLFSFHFVERGADEISDGPRPEVSARTMTHSHGSVADFLVPEHQHVGDLLQLRFPDLIANLLDPVVQFDPEPGADQPLLDRFGIVNVTVGDREQRHLNRSEPQRPGTSIVLQEKRQEPLKTAKNCTVNDDRPVFRVVGADVLQVEPLRQLVVELNRSALPLAADGVGNVEVDLGTVECAVTLVDGVRLPGRLQSLFE